jgi:hypothetical protein
LFFHRLEGSIPLRSSATCFSPCGSTKLLVTAP